MAAMLHITTQTLEVDHPQTWVYSMKINMHRKTHHPNICWTHMCHSSGNSAAAGRTRASEEPSDSVLSIWRRVDAVCFDVDL